MTLFSSLALWLLKTQERVVPRATSAPAVADAPPQTQVRYAPVWVTFITTCIACFHLAL